MCPIAKTGEEFVVFVDRIEGKYAVCELPDETMCDIERTKFPASLKEREKYIVMLSSYGDVIVLSRIVEMTKKPNLPNKLIRFS